MQHRNQIIFGDCIESLTDLENQHGRFADVVITSPPYKEADGAYEFDYFTWLTNLQYVLKTDGLLFLNIGHLAENKSFPFELALQAVDLGFHLQETIVWVKNQYCPITGYTRLNNLTEFIFMFYNETMPELDRAALAVPYEDKANVRRFGQGIDLKLPGNVWRINMETINATKKRLHPDQQPVGLPERCLKLCRKIKARALAEGRRPIVLDTFGGSGTTAIAAMREDWDFILMEQKPEYCTVAQKRIARAKADAAALLFR